MKRRMCLMLAVILSLIMMLGNDFESFAAEEETNYLTFTAEEADSSVTVDYTSGTDVEYSLDGQAWVTCLSGTDISLKNVGDSVKLRGKNIKTGYYDHFKMTGKIAASGSVTSLTDGKGVDSNVSLDEECYSYMFFGCTSLTEAPKLPAMTLASSCYSDMFSSCSSLTEAPKLPAMTLADNCYSGMFSCCGSLIKVPELPAEKLENQCYSGMFSSCSSLTEAPNLSATILTDSCYSYMFCDCTSLIKVPELPAEKLEPGCYSGMFYCCTSLTEAPKLPAMTLARSCYSYMFCDCTSLIKVPELPAEKLENQCYSCMFDGCTSLTEAPKLPATTLASNCYSFMFSGCTSLIKVPELPAEKLEPQCYLYMFSGCTSLTEAPELTAEKLENQCYSGMFNDCTSLTEASKLPAMTLASSCYSYMFSGCTSLIKVPELTAEKLELECYSGMFNGCTSLTEAPKLPAMTLADNCYSYMFCDCTSLTEVPELPATELKYACYLEMFSDCTSLTEAPKLPAMTLAVRCYSYMFYGCTSLTEAPELLAITLADNCYSYMFSGCTTLTEVPELPATTLADNCYSNMFNGCSNLLIATKELSDYFTKSDNWTLLSAEGTNNAYKDMFYGASTATDIPKEDRILSTPTYGTYYILALPNYLTFTAEETNSSVTVKYMSGTDVEYSKNNGVWENCPTGTTISLENIGDYIKLRGTKFKTDATNHFEMTGKIAASGSVTSLTDERGVAQYVTLSNSCYSYMFFGCESLTRAPELPAKALSSGCYSYMFSKCTSLTVMPKLPATTLASYCYISMFSGCSNLLIAKSNDVNGFVEKATLELPSIYSGITNLKPYIDMFADASTETDIPENDRMESEPSEGTYYILTKTNYLTFTAEEADSSVTVNYVLGTNVEYSKNNGAWKNCPTGTTISLEDAEDYVKLRGKNIRTNNSKHFEMTGKIAASGNVTSLTDGYGADSYVSLGINCYSYMFSGCTSLTKAPELPAKTLAVECYKSMFSGCTSLTKAPELPAKTLAVECYKSMFSGCTALTEAPEKLPAETLAGHCYGYMFSDCTSLTKAPKLSATALAGYCYESMFSGCTSLTEAPELTAETLTDKCYNSMFSGCTSLTKAPELPAETLAGYCYESMFSGCTSLTEAPELPAETLEGYCYVSMFSGCTSLTEAPKLPATTLTSMCYSSMFSGCTSLIKAPELPATTLREYCYSGMFSGCTSLTEVPELPATELKYACYSDMFKGCSNLLIATKELPDYVTKSNLILPSDEGVTDPYYGMFEGTSTATDIPEEYRMPGTPTEGTYYILEEIKKDPDPDPDKPDPDPDKPDPDPDKPDPDPDPGKPDPDPDNPDPNPAKPEIKYVVPDDVTLIPPSEEGKMPTAEKNGVVFAGWKDENGNIINDPNLITKDTILTPLWENITVVCKQKLSISYIFKNALDSYKESVKKEKEALGETFKENKDIKYRYRVLNKKEYSGVVSMNAIGIRNQSGTASVTDKGILNCKKAGTVAIKLEVKVKNGKKTEWLQLPGSEIIFVSIEKPAKIKDAKTTLRFIGDSVSFNGIVKYDRPSEIENNPNMSKLSVQIKSKNDVVSYDETTGNFVANKNGKAMITATYNAEAGVNKNGEPVYSKVKITFNIKVKIPEFKKAALKVKNGKTVKTSLKNVTKKDTVTYTSSNEAVATVDAKGKVTGVSAGTAVITADIEGKTYTCEVTVE